MCVDERCTIVTSAPFSHSAPQMSKAELFDPITTHFLPRVGVRTGVRRRVVLVAPERRPCRGRSGRFGLPLMPVAKTSCVQA